MKRLPKQNTSLRPIYKREQGFGLHETLIALAAGTLIITAAAVGVQSTQSLMKTSEEKASQRQNTLNGLRLMRSEIERSLHALVNGEPQDPELDYTKLSRLNDKVQICQAIANRLPSTTSNLSAEQRAGFIPLYALKMNDDGAYHHVFYGLGKGSNSGTFSIQRCGSQLDLDGNYRTTAIPYVATVLNGIAAMPCLSFNTDGECTSTLPTDFGEKVGKTGIKPEDVTRDDVLLYLSTLGNGNYGFEVLSDNKTPGQGYLMPALRFQTDNRRKLIRFVGPMDCPTGSTGRQCIQTSQLSVSSSADQAGRQPLQLTAYARADKRLINPDDQSSGLTSNWVTGGQPITSDRVRFLVDGSGSMGACMDWSRDDRGELIPGSSTREFQTPQDDPARVTDPSYRYSPTYNINSYVCNQTRMERLKEEMTKIIENLPSDTKIGIEIFSSTSNNGVSYYNNRQWSRSEDGLVTIGENRESALEFISSFDMDENGDYIKPSTWGGTNPWNALLRAFSDHSADTLYFLSDGLPTSDFIVKGSRIAEVDDDFNSAADYFDDVNDERIANGHQSLTVNTASIMLHSAWMEKLAELTNGHYSQARKKESSGKSNNGHGNNSDSCDSSNPSATFSHCTQDDENKP